MRFEMCDLNFQLFDHHISARCNREKGSKVRKYSKQIDVIKLNLYENTVLR